MANPAVPPPGYAPLDHPLLTELPSRPAVKKARLPPGAKMISRTLNTARHRLPANVTREDQRLTPKRRIDIRRGTSLVSVLKRVQKLLDKSPRGVLSQSLPGVSSKKKGGAKGGGHGGAGSGRGADDGITAAHQQQQDERFDVLVVGTGGHNIEKALKTAAVFQRRGDCVVRLYTNTVSGVDTYEHDEEETEEKGDDDGDGVGGDAAAENSGGADVTMPEAAGRPAGENGERFAGMAVGKTVKQRARKASSLEVGIRLK